MNSFAIGLRLRQREKENKEVLEKENKEALEKEELPQITFHSNVWKMPSSSFFGYDRFFIDFGIKASFLYDRILIYLPFVIDKENGWSDLGKVLKSETILSALFDSDCTRVADLKTCYQKISLYEQEDINRKNAKDTFYLYPLDRHNLSIVNGEKGEEDNRGTWLEIKILDLPEDLSEVLGVDRESDIEKLRKGKFYIRFRIQIKDPRQFTVTRRLSNDLIQAAFSKMELYDLRFNENRNLDDKLEEKFKPEQYRLAVFEEADIFFVASSRVLVDNGSAIKTDSRIIEPDVWSDYELPHNPDNIFIAHHWRVRPCKQRPATDGGNESKKSPKAALDLFFTATFPKIQYGTLISYFMIIALIGSVGSWLADGGYQCSRPVETIDPDASFYQTINPRGWVFICIGLYLLVWMCRRIRWKVKMWLKEL